MSLASRIALVTGAASGLGRATAVRFANAGAQVVLLDLPQAADMANDVAKSLGEKAIFVPTDVTNADQVRVILAKSQVGAHHKAIFISLLG